jgi:hypothetical protein
MTQRTIIYGFTGVGLGLALGFATLSWSVNGATAVPRQTPQEDKPIEQTRKNIQMLKGLPESQLFLVMNFVGDSLGVHCDYCHVKNGKNPQTGADNWIWDSDAKQEKLVARDMMRMVLDLNRTKFNREALVTCYTCHRGSTAPERMAPLPPRDFAKEALQSLKTAFPSAQEIVSKYFSAVRAGAASSLPQTIKMTGTVERSNGPPIPFEVTFRQPNKYLVKQTTPQGLITQGTNGTSGWIKTGKGVTTLSAENVRQFREAVALYSPFKIPDSSHAILAGIAKVGDHEAYLLTIQQNPTRSIQMFFDRESGLLLRLVTVTNTILGPLNEQKDFADYRDIGGIKLAFTIRTSDVAAFDTVTRRFTKILSDSTVDESIFEVPPRVASP